MIEPSAEDVGRRVVYTGNRYPGGKPERGVIKQFTQHAVFVTYDGDSFAKGTNRRDLEWDDVRSQGAQLPDRPPEGEPGAEGGGAAEERRDAGRLPQHR